MKLTPAVVLAGPVCDAGSVVVSTLACVETGAPLVVATLVGNTVLATPVSNNGSVVTVTTRVVTVVPPVCVSEVCSAASLVVKGGAVVEVVLVTAVTDRLTPANAKFATLPRVSTQSGVLIVYCVASDGGVRSSGITRVPLSGDPVVRNWAAYPEIGKLDTDVR